MFDQFPMSFPDWTRSSFEKLDGWMGWIAHFDEPLRVSILQACDEIIVDGAAQPGDKDGNA